MDGQWSVTRPAAHTLTQRDCQIAAGYNNLSMGLNVESDEDMFMFFTSEGTNNFKTLYGHNVTCCTFLFFHFCLVRNEKRFLTPCNAWVFPSRVKAATATAAPQRDLT